MRKQDLIYIAGFFDGEGSINIVKTKFKSGPYLQISASNTNKEVIEFIYKILQKGSISQWLRKGGKKAYQWKTQYKSAGEILKLLLPYLKVKKEKAKLGIEFQKLMGKVGKQPLTEKEIKIREKYRQKMCSLNK